MGTIDGLFKLNNAQRAQEFFRNAKVLEKTMDGRLDITLVTFNGIEESKEILRRTQDLFESADMEGRVSSIKDAFQCAHAGGLKAEMVREIAKQEKQNDISMCIYAGDTNEEKQMANWHARGDLYKCPHVFVDTAANNFTAITDCFKTLTLAAAKEQNLK